MKCRICGADETGDRRITARERMFGTLEEFEYLECSSCGCLQIVDVPDDLGRHYPADYYSFAETTHPVKQWVKQRRGGQSFGRPTRAGAVLQAVLGPPHFVPWLAHATTTSPKVLDVGAGQGLLVADLRTVGIDALGVDPFLDADVTSGGTTTGDATTGYGSTLVRACTLAALAELDDRYDLVMFHHSLEHIEHQLETLEQARALLRPGGTVLVRIPLSDSFARRTHGTHWIQLDAPRHLFLHTRRSMRLLAEQAGFRVDDVVEDSAVFQLRGSEWYAAGNTLATYRHPGRLASRLDPRLRRLQRQVDELNRTHDGDQAAFVLRVADTAS